MYTVYACITHQHDFRLILLAAAICGLASFNAVNLLGHAAQDGNVHRKAWLAGAAVSTGFGIWATHFIAMLAFSSGVASGYNTALTGLSLIEAVALTALGFAVAFLMPYGGGRALGGAIVGSGIAVMHYTGMRAFEIAGQIHWDATLVVTSVLLGTSFGALALHLGLGGPSRAHKILGALTLALAICSTHFVGMGAVTLVPDPAIVISQTAIPNGWLAGLITVAAASILLLAVACLALDIREKRHKERETKRMIGLADAAFEGLLVCDRDTIVTVNASLVALLHKPASDVLGYSLETVLPDRLARSRLFERFDSPFETVLHQQTGNAVPVEVISRTIELDDRPHLAIAVRDLRYRKEAETHIHYLAHHDHLTGLINRNAFNEKLDDLIASHRSSGLSLAILFVDLDRFKEVNDLYGHAAGDSLLKTVARSVTGVLSETQQMARLGGDEFAIVAPGLDDPVAQVSRLAEAVLRALKVENDQSRNTGALAASIGIAIFPDDALDRELLLHHADTALYCAKADGRGTFRLFESKMGIVGRDRRLIEHDLRTAIERSELRLVFQPQAHTSSQEISGFEALLRWQHPERGLVSPSVFIPIAEASGLILQIGEWVLSEACFEAARWKSPLSVAVNVSTVQLHSPNFAHRVHEILIQSGLPPKRLELEITETALIRDLDRALFTMRQLKHLGVKIAMDDFGTGYSSLSNLRAFPFDKIKIDASFIRSVGENAQAAAIVRAILGLGQGLQMPVIAEGVETQEELLFLDEEGCLEVQGFLLGRPQPIAAFSKVTGRDPQETAADQQEWAIALQA